ncbi:MAG: hypothetical protein JO287_10420 [Pseudonocardiales bacterium]|nr:hypothetical protein [Pseudonocardiales bacterium]
MSSSMSPDLPPTPPRPVPVGHTSIAAGLLVALVMVGSLVTFIVTVVVPDLNCRTGCLCDACVVTTESNPVPWWALGIGVLLGVIGGGIALWRRRSPLPYISVGVVGFLVTLAASPAVIYTGNAQSPIPDPATDLTQMVARPNYEDVRNRLGQMQNTLNAQLSKALPGIKWPNILDYGKACGYAVQANNFSGSTPITGLVTADQWSTFDNIIRQTGARYGFSGPPLDIDHPNHAARLRLTTADGTSLSVEGEVDSPLHDGILVELTTPCYLTANGRSQMSSQHNPQPTH